MTPADLFKPKRPGDQAAEVYIEAHVFHTEREREALAGGWIEQASEEHEAARIALRAYNAEKLTKDDPHPKDLR